MKTKNINFMNDIKLTAIIKPKPKVNKNMIQPFFIARFCGTRGSGKTYTAVKLIIELIKEGSLKGQDIYIISPTFYSNLHTINLDSRIGTMTSSIIAKVPVVVDNIYILSF